MNYAECKSCGAIPEIITDFEKIKPYIECEYCGMRLTAININYETYREIIMLNYAVKSDCFQLVKVFGMNINVVDN